MPGSQFSSTRPHPRPWSRIARKRLNTDRSFLRTATEAFFILASAVWRAASCLSCIQELGFPRLAGKLEQECTSQSASSAAVWRLADSQRWAANCSSFLTSRSSCRAISCSCASGLPSKAGYCGRSCLLTDQVIAFVCSARLLLGPTNDANAVPLQYWEIAQEALAWFHRYCHASVPATWSAGCTHPRPRTLQSLKTQFNRPSEQESPVARMTQLRTFTVLLHQLPVLHRRYSQAADL